MDGLDAFDSDILCGDRHDPCDHDPLGAPRSTVPRKGFLMITTTRGERLFIALLLTGWINIFWIMATNASQWGALGAGLVVSAIVLAFG